jgi:hypothetical protein
MSKPKKEIVIGPCSYCGNEGKVEDDHVVPEAIFVNVNQATIKVPSCRKCNVQKSAGEDDLRDFMVISVGVDGHPDIYPLMEKMAEAYGKGFSKIGKAADESRKLVLRRGKGGVLYPAFSVPFDDPWHMDRTLRYIVRGLYFHEFQRPWLKDQPLSLSTIPQENFDDVFEFFATMPGPTFREPLGNNVFTWMPISAADNPDVVAWPMVFFGRVIYVGYTGIPEDDDYFKRSFPQLIRQKGKREKQLRGIVDRRLIMPPPDDMLGFLRWHEERKKRTLR